MSGAGSACVSETLGDFREGSESPKAGATGS